MLFALPLIHEIWVTALIINSKFKKQQKNKQTKNFIALHFIEMKKTQGLCTDRMMNRKHSSTLLFHKCASTLSYIHKRQFGNVLCHTVGGHVKLCSNTLTALGNSVKITTYERKLQMRRYETANTRNTINELVGLPYMEFPLWVCNLQNKSDKLKIPFHDKICKKKNTTTNNYSNVN